MEAAFLKCVTDAPDDRTARLVFADWLREQDAPALRDRGELIHTQCALIEGNVPRDHRAALIVRQKELLARHREEWEAPFRALVNGCEFRMGFAERVTLSAEQFVDNLGELVQRTPVVRVRLSGLTTDTVEFVAAVPELGRVRELDLNRRPVEAAALRDLLASPNLARLRYLNLVRTGTGDDGVRALIASPVFRQLRYLNLSHAGVSAAGVRTLVNAIYNRTPALEMLVLRGASRLEPRSFPPPPPGLSFRLRQSLASQLGLGAEPGRSVLVRLYETRATLPSDFRRLVELIHTQGVQQLARAVTAVPPPAPVRDAFVLVCERRIVWRVSRSGGDLPAIPLDTDGRTDLSEVLRLLLHMAAVTSVGSLKEAQALADCLLDLYLRYERDELPANGLTR